MEEAKLTPPAVAVAVAANSAMRPRDARVPAGRGRDVEFSQTCDRLLRMDYLLRLPVATIVRGFQTPRST